MANPYAPPAAAAYVVPATELPAGFRRFRLEPAAFRRLVRRQAVLRVPFVLVVLALVLGIESLAGMPVGLASWIVVPSVLIGFALRWARAARLAARPMATFEVIASPRVVRRIMAGLLPAEILRPEITRIVETPWGLWLLSTTPRRSLGLVRAIDGYDALRAHVGTWAPIESIGLGERLWLRLREARRMGPRDVIAGTALATDPTLLEELGLIRAVGADRGAGFGPATLVRNALLRVLLLWVLLIVLFLAIWQFLAPTERPARPRGRPPTTLPAP